MSAKWVTPDRKVVDIINVKYPCRGGDRAQPAGTQFRVRDIHGHYLGSAKTVEALATLGIDLATLEEIS